MSTPKVLIVGAGMSGMLVAIRLARAGIDSFEILEKAAKVGGTWRENSYPGLKCDVPAYMYTYSFEPNPEWSHRFATGAEIQQYFERVYAKYDLARYVRFGVEVESATYEDGGWTVKSKDGAVRRADVLVSAAGILHHPRAPDIPGLETFAGKTWHSARWNHSIDLSDKRVGLVGTGSTAVQIVCGLAGKTRKLTQFQRTAQWVHPQFDGDYSEWSKKILRAAPWLAGFFQWAYKRVFDLTFSRIPLPRSYIHRMLAFNCRRALETVADPALRARLTPDYVPGCKRLILADGYYEAIQDPSCELVTEGIERIEPGGVRTRDGRLHELDVLVTATGFYAHNYMRPMRVIGENGLELNDFWEPGAIAHRGVAMSGFPNFFVLLGPHSPIGNFSVIAISEAQVDYVMQFIELLRQGKAQRVQPRVEAMQRYNEAMRAAIKDTVWVAGGCQSWYLDASGLPALWPWTFSRYKRELEGAPLSEFELRT
jgi:cation diffusion facilitator CzcD-associated flavoprotein CzcO